MNQKLVFFDTETGGLLDDSPIIQIAAIATDSDLNELESFQVKLLFDIGLCQDDALSLNSFDPKVWEDEAIAAVQACGRFADFLRRHSTVKMISKKGSPYYVAQGVGHNALNFDAPRLQRLFKSFNMFLPMGFLVWDTCQRACFWFFEHPEVPPPENMKLQTIATHLNLVRLGEAHDALADVRLCVSLYSRLHGEAVHAATVSRGSNQVK